MADPETLQDEIQADPLLQELYSRTEKAMDSDPGHNLAHALRVARWTVELAPPQKRTAAIAAALLHDIVNIPKDSLDRAKASERSAEVAVEWLADLGVPEELRTEVSGAIRSHSYSRGEVPTTDLGKALQDADRLEAIGALGLLRTISTGTLMGSEYFHESDPWAEKRELDDRRFMVDHFFRKLLKLPETMQTEAGKEEANARVSFLVAFLEQLGHELGSACPSARTRRERTSPSAS